MPSFNFLVSGPYVDQLGEYSTPQQKIGRGRFAGTARVTNPAPGTSVTDNAVQQMLEGEVARKSLPAPTANTLYFTFLPPGVTVEAGRSAPARHSAVITTGPRVGCITRSFRIPIARGVSATCSRSTR